jgi:hypothetical protein
MPATWFGSFWVGVVGLSLGNTLTKAGQFGIPASYMPPSMMKIMQTG